MASADETRDRGRTTGAVSVGRSDHHNHSTETKASFKTTELPIYLAVLAGILISGLVVNGGDNSSDPDLFTASQVWLYATILTLGYLLSRGLAKSGSREPYSDDNH